MQKDGRLVSEDIFSLNWHMSPTNLITPEGLPESSLYWDRKKYAAN
jgi:hypothetical protein